ncbi:divergent polysaccharide deacetylase family protein [uncultured Campylobacter sp.]|uniref:divergent polysaccharide deacetylase family protein n=1 Tax=uncultured Campylobacter sp. TaxID=218934 RepID=UPI002610F6C1|nr:divergent polysaccharide deacetylase family protein [uncultured Campylobacter sp.]
MNSKSRKRSAKKRPKKGRLRGGFKLLFSAIFIACILLVGAFVGAFYFLDVKFKPDAAEKLIAKAQEYLSVSKKEETANLASFKSGTEDADEVQNSDSIVHSRANLTDIKALFAQASLNEASLEKKDNGAGATFLQASHTQSELGSGFLNGDQDERTKFVKRQNVIARDKISLESRDPSELEGAVKNGLVKKDGRGNENLNSPDAYGERNGTQASKSANKTQSDALEQTLKSPKFTIDFGAQNAGESGLGDADAAGVDKSAQTQNQDDRQEAKVSIQMSGQSAQDKEDAQSAKNKDKTGGEKDEKPQKLAGSISEDKKSKIYSKLGAKPRLVIIIDDVAYRHQVDAIKSVNLKLTPSFFPATSAHPETPVLARRFSFHMIHLPMQALGGFKGAEIGTLTVNDDYEKIAKKLQSIKRDFPNLKYINNHTGSRFTSDATAMDRLMRAMRDENLIFVDSKTTSPTKVYGAAKKYSMPYIARDVFLDHDGSKAAVRKQLKYAVELAKKRSYAIAIGHPHKNTIEVLQESSKLLQEVEVVYLKDLF